MIGLGVCGLICANTRCNFSCFYLGWLIKPKFLCKFAAKGCIERRSAKDSRHRCWQQVKDAI